MAFGGDFSSDQLIAFTFFIGSMAMMAATAFFWLEMRNIDAKWRTSLLVSGLITFIAAVHYYYMRDYYIMASGGAVVQKTRLQPSYVMLIGFLLFH